VKIGNWQRWLSQHFQELKLAIQLPFRVFAFIKALFLHGYVEVITAFEYKKESHAFRTLIQVDADIMNFIPDPQAFRGDKKGLRMMKNLYQEHQKKIEDIIQILQGNKSFVGKFIDFALVVTNAYPIYEAFIDPDTRSAIISGSIATASLLFRKYLKPFVVEFLMKGVFKIFRFYLGRFTG